MRRRVVVTGVGCISPLGTAAETVWQKLLNGESGVRPISLFDANSFPVRIAAEVPNWSLDELGDEAAPLGRHARQTQFAVAAAMQAATDAGFDERSIEPTRTGVLLGCGEIFPDFGQFCDAAGSASVGPDFDLCAFMREATEHNRLEDEEFLEPGSAVSLIAGLFDAQGPSANITAACVSSSKAIGEAAEIIRRGDAEVMFSGGAHSMIHPFGITGFHRLSTLSTRNDEPERASRPFDWHRDGFVVGEGGAILILEELEHAKKRRANILAEITGYGSTHDAFRITDLDPEGRAASRCMSMALADAQLNPQDITYINAHGSGTTVNDKAETIAIKKAFGDLAPQVPISSTKSMTGHLTTACGAIEMFVCALAIRDGAIPPTINLENADPACDLDYTPNQARSSSCRHVMSNSFGFGGQNVTLVASRFDG